MIEGVEIHSVQNGFHTMKNVTGHSLWSVNYKVNVLLYNVFEGCL